MIFLIALVSNLPPCTVPIDHSILLVNLPPAKRSKNKSPRATTRGDLTKRPARPLTAAQFILIPGAAQAGPTRPTAAVGRSLVGSIHRTVCNIYEELQLPTTVDTDTRPDGLGEAAAHVLPTGPIVRSVGPGVIIRD